MSKDKKEGEKPKTEVPPEEEAAQSKKKKLLVFGIAGAGLLLGIGAGLFFFLAGGSSKKNDSVPPGEHGGAAETKEGDGHSGEPTDGQGDHKSDSSHGEAKSQDHKKEKDDKKPSKENKDSKADHGGGDAKKAEASKDGHGGDKSGGQGGGHGEGEKKEEGAHGAEKKKDSKNSDEKLEGVDFGCTVPLTPFHLNLGNPLENRYIRLEVSLEYGCAEEQKAEINKRLPQLRDAIISVTSRKTREFLLGPDGKEQLRKEIHNRVNHYMTKKIDDVYITDILIE